ncbi:MAG: hypothetical protein KAJ40_05510 [Alphaproteobacteria bacterium]|nr:hypothetical protein [Alphaproteobacteria bacterium]
MEDLQKLGEEIEELHNENIDVVEESSVVRSNLDVALQNMYYAASDLAYEGYFAQLDLEMMENSGYYSPEEIQAQKEIIEQCYTAVDAHDDLRETMLGYIHKMEKSEQALTEEDRILSGNFEALKEKIGNKEPTPEDKEALAKLHSEKINIETSRGQLAKFSKLTASFTEIITDVSRDKNLSLEQKTHGYETLNLVAKSSGDRHLDGKELAQIKENMLKVDPKSPYFARCCELLVKSGVTIEDGKGGKISGQEAVDHFIKSLGEAKVAANATPNGQVIQPGLKQGAVIPTTRGPDMAAATPTSYGCFADNEFNKTNPTTGPIPSYAVTTQNNAPDIGDVNEAHLAALAKTGTGTGDTGTDKETLAMEELLKQLERDQQNIPTSNPLA